MLKDDVGPFVPNALDSEATAIIAATEFLLSREWLSQIEIFFHYDALSAGHGAFGLQNIPNNNHDVSERQKAARMMVALLQRKAECCRGLHVKAHNGQPWNELADSVASAIRQGWQPPCEAKLRCKELLTHPLANFAWIEAGRTDEIPALETVLRNHPPDPDRGEGGQAGVELWLNGEALSKSFGVSFSPIKDACVWFQSSRILATTCHFGTLQIEIITIYAPQQARPAEEIRRWWSQLDQVIAKAAEASWLHAALQSLKWLQQQLGDEAVPSELFQLHDEEMWFVFQDATHELHALLKKAERAHLLRIRTFLALRTLADDQAKIFRQMGWTIPEVEGEVEAECSVFRCDECERCFETAASLAVHQQRRHQQRAAVRRVTTDGVCRFQHVEKDQLWRWAEESELQPHLPLLDAESDLDADPTESELAAWAQLGMLPAGQGGRTKTIRGHADLQLYNVAFETNRLEKKLHDQVGKWNKGPLWVPKPLADGRKFLLVLFSGHRRDFDVAQFTSWTSDLIPISIDLAIDRECGNILHDGMWRDLIRSRKVSGAHGAPPCETFSLARPTEKLGGRHNGAWRTTWAKEYPPKLCQALAEGHVNHSRIVPTCGEEADPPGLQRFLDCLAKVYDPYYGDLEGTVMKSDYDRSAAFAISRPPNAVK
eukprot:s362_g2.t1